MSADKSTSNVDINSLPNEILIKIIRLCLVSETPIQPTKRMTKVQVNQAIKREAVGKLDFSRVYRPALGISPNILVTCTKLKELGTEMLYTENVIDFSDSYINTIRARAFEYQVGPAKASSIKSVYFGQGPLGQESLNRLATPNLSDDERHFILSGRGYSNMFKKTFTPHRAFEHLRSCIHHLRAVQHVLVETNFHHWTPTNSDVTSLGGFQLHCVHSRLRYGIDGSLTPQVDIHCDQTQLEKSHLQGGYDAEGAERYGQSGTVMDSWDGESYFPYWEAVIWPSEG